MRQRQPVPARRSVLISIALLWSTFLQAVHAELHIYFNYSTQCTPLGISWTFDPSAFPYSLYIVSLDSKVESFLINKDAVAPNDNQVTFHYLVSQPTPDFQKFVVAVADSKGHGNTTEVLWVNHDDASPTFCAPYHQTKEFAFAAEPVSGKGDTDRPACGNVLYHPVPINGAFQGNPPFSISFLPIGQTPITIDIPSNDVHGSNNFTYMAPVPFAPGTRFIQFMSDALGGGSGGSTPVYTTSAGGDTSCFAPGYTLPNVNPTNTLPPGGALVADTSRFGPTVLSQDTQAGSSALQPNTMQTQTQTQPQSQAQSQPQSWSGSGSQTGLQTWSGAQSGSPLQSQPYSSSSSPSSSSSQSQSQSPSPSNRGLIDGIVAAVACIAAILAITTGYCLYRRRREKKRTTAGSTSTRFDRLDEDQRTTLAGSTRQRPDDSRLSCMDSPSMSEGTVPFTSPLFREVMQFRDVIEGYAVPSPSSSGMGAVDMSTSNVRLPEGGSPVAVPNSPSSANARANTLINVQSPTSQYMETMTVPSAVAPDIQGTYRSAVPDVPGTYRPTVPDLQGTYRPGSGSIDESAFWRSPSAAGQYPEMQAGHVCGGVTDVDTGNSVPQNHAVLYSMMASTQGGEGGVYEAGPSQGPPSLRIQTDQLGSSPGSSETSSVPTTTASLHSAVIQHQDAGPARTSLDEVPPSYGQWVSPDKTKEKGEGSQGQKRDEVQESAAQRQHITG